MTHSFIFRERTTDRMAAAVVTLLPFLYFLPAVRGQLIISPDDGVIFNVPLRVATANLIRAGYAPLWNPDIFSGMPLHAAAQAGVLFPLNWFYLFCSPQVATNLMMLSTYALAALGAYLYARRAGADIAGAVVTGIAWQSGAVLVGQIGHTNILQTAALLPWLLWAIDGYGATGRRGRGVLLAVIVALQMFAGHQQTFSYALLVAAAYALVLWRRSDPVKPERSAYLRSVVLLAAGLALAAVQILPTVELLRNSMRADSSYDFFTSFSLPPRFLWTFFAPYVLGGGDGNLFRAPYVGPDFYAEYVGYVGLASIALAGVALGLKRDTRTTFWVIVVVVGLLLALGGYAPFHFYKLIYVLPVLNLFRVPARHLMEVNFALAVLAGRGVTAINQTSDRWKAVRWALMTSGIVLVLTCLAITIGRPANFQLARSAPLTILRAPELFLPVVIAVVNLGILWLFAKRRQSWTLLLLMVFLFVDLAVWGQFSGWRISSPRRDHKVWTEPETTPLLHARVAAAKSIWPYRILTEDQQFDPVFGLGPPSRGSGWEPLLQPDIHMMYGEENAAGYDGFGLARYSRLAGDMKVWGELTDPTRTLGNDSRELDVLNVRFLLARAIGNSTHSGALPDETNKGISSEFPPATQVYSGQHFGDEDLNWSAITTGQRLAFSLPPERVDRIALLTNLSWSEAVPDGTVVGHLRLTGPQDQTFDADIRAGEHTSEWAFDRRDISLRIKHKRAPVGTSREVEDANGKYQSHTYVCSFQLPSNMIVTGGVISVVPVKNAPSLGLNVTRIAFADADQTFAVRREWVKKQAAPSADKQSTSGVQSEPTTPAAGANQRWEPVDRIGNVVVLENKHALPRAWLTSGEIVVNDEQALDIIRSSKTPDGETWDPLQKALVASSTGIQFANVDEARLAEVTVLEPNRVVVSTQSTGPALLVLSANHYPSWRAYVDGRSAAVARVDFNLRGVEVPAGNHLVTFVYRPKSVLIGLIVSLITLAALLLWWRFGIPGDLGTVGVAGND